MLETIDTKLAELDLDFDQNCIGKEKHKIMRGYYLRQKLYYLKNRIQTDEIQEEIQKTIHLINMER